MKTRLIGIVLIMIALIASGLYAASRDGKWEDVRKAANAGLPKTALEALEPIIAGSTADKSYPEMIRAIAWKIALEGTIQGNQPEEKIVRLEAEMAKAPTEAKPVLETILAEWYWQYFQRNRWRFLQRTQTAAGSGTDLQAWDLARILTEIDAHFTAALNGAETLKRTPIADYEELLIEGNVSDVYRPTLFDFLANEALKFYQAGEQAGVAPEDRFELDAESPIFADTAEFMRWRPQPAENNPPALAAVRIYQKLLRFHAGDADRSAYFDADLARLVYGLNAAVGPNKDARYRAALERFINATAGHEIQARGRAALAEQLRSEGDLVAAHAQARQGITAYPASTGAAQCFNLVQEIEAPSSHLQTESVWNAPWPTLDVTYRNVRHVYFRAVALDFDDYLSRAQWNLSFPRRQKFPELLIYAPALAWDVELPPTDDFKERTERLPAPASLKPGFYAIVASHDPTFGEPENQVSVATVWVSDLALVLRGDPRAERRGGMVLAARSGEPVAGAVVRFWRPDSQGYFSRQGETRSNENGWFSLPRDGAVVVLAEHGGQAVSSREVIRAGREVRRNGTTEHTIFFTDRAIYRPGQAINYKGLCLSVATAADSCDVLARERVTVIFRDANGGEIARARHKTNDYGSFSGVFMAPRGRLTGRMSIAIEDGPDGSTQVSVEEYKRPKFQVVLDAPAEAAKLGTTVKLMGKATAYSGAAIGGAKVTWRVERSTRLPLWCWWWFPPATQAVAHGTAITGPDGTFPVEFPAVPDRAIPAGDEPVFTFNVNAAVTDGTGETRSDERRVLAGYTALQAAIVAEEWQTPARPSEFAITTQSLDGHPQPANGTVTIYALKQPASVPRAALTAENRWWAVPDRRPAADPADPRAWETGELVTKLDFAAGASGEARVSATLKPGVYRARLETQDRFGRNVTARATLQVVDPNEAVYRIKLPNHFSARAWSVEPGETFTALWGTGYESGRAFVEVECKGTVLQSYWTGPGRTQEIVQQPVTEAMRGGFTVRVSYVRENRAYISQRVVDVPWSNKQLSIKWEHFRSKLLPGEKETWTAVVSGPEARRASAEMVATLYDASLDSFEPLSWPEAVGFLHREDLATQVTLQNALESFNFLQGRWGGRGRDVALDYRSFPAEIVSNLWGWQYAQAGKDGAVMLSPFEVSSPENTGYRASTTLAGSRLRTELKDYASSINVLTSQKMPDATPQPKPDLEKVAARKNLNETAFFFPHLLADKEGVVRMTFTMPEALTEWKFLGFAHDAQLRSGLLTDRVVTAKDLMVEPNPPRFVREGDAIEFTVKVSNQSQQPQRGTVRLTFADTASQQSVDAALGNSATEQAFEVPPQQSRSYAWRIVVPDGLGFLTYKAVAASGNLSDGEKGYLPVLNRRVLVTEALPLSIRGPGTKEFQFKKLLGSGASATLRQQSLTVQMTSQPAWYAVMALPYLMEFPYECSEQLFNRFYANALARHIANSDPKIRRVFDLWRNTPALDSPLEKNEELKSVMLEETPWLREAKDESAARRKVGLLFDRNRLEEETAAALSKLASQQGADGLWPWFPGGPASEFVSLYIVTGFGRLNELGVETNRDTVTRALAALDAWMDQRYRQIQRGADAAKHVPDPLEALYLYGRSFYLKDRPIRAEQKEAVDYFLRQAKEHWLDLNVRQSQAHLAIALNRFGDADTARAILRSIKERSVHDEELGMFWRDGESSWWWYGAPIETQALMVEAFAEVANDTDAVENCKVWLLQQKRTQNWSTTKATADAVYALLLRGRNLLASDAIVEVALGGTTVRPEKTEAGTGFYEKRFAGNEVKPAMGRVTVKKADEGVSWGGVHWQYLEEIAKVSPHEDTPLRLKKTFFVKATTARGQVLKPVAGPLAVGDELVVRIELRTDRDLEFVHLKDQRGSGTEPVNVLSGYRYRDSLGYYESTRDTASHFFIDRLPKGTYVFEYSTRVQLRGRYQSGLAEIECMYAPEFRSHSESRELVVE